MQCVDINRCRNYNSCKLGKEPCKPKKSKKKE